MATSNKQVYTHTLASVGLTLAYPNYTVAILQQIKRNVFLAFKIAWVFSKINPCAFTPGPHSNFLPMLVSLLQSADYLMIFHCVLYPALSAQSNSTVPPPLPPHTHTHPPTPPPPSHLWEQSWSSSTWQWLAGRLCTTVAPGGVSTPGGLPHWDDGSSQ